MKAHAPGQSPLLLLDVVRVLAVGGIDYAVIGAMAAAVHGTIRGTTDADAVLSISLQRLKKLEIALAQTGLLTELRRGDQDDPIPAMLVVRDAHDNRVDLLAGLRGLDPNSFSRTIAVPFHGDSIRVIGCEDFIAMKCFAGGPQDLVDAREALRTRRCWICSCCARQRGDSDKTPQMSWRHCWPPDSRTARPVENQLALPSWRFGRPAMRLIAVVSCLLLPCLAPAAEPGKFSGAAGKPIPRGAWNWAIGKI